MYMSPSSPSPLGRNYDIQVRYRLCVNETRRNKRKLSECQTSFPEGRVQNYSICIEI